MAKKLCKLLGITIILGYITIFLIIKLKDSYEYSTINSIIKNNIHEYKDYTAIIEIPKIDLKKFLYNDENNTVDKNIMILNNSSMPDEDGYLALASHSGNGYNSYFKDLHKLRLNDLVYIYYNGIKYTYKITTIYKEPKSKDFYINDIYSKALILITCSGSNRIIMIADNI